MNSVYKPYKNDGDILSPKKSSSVKKAPQNLYEFSSSLNNRHYQILEKQMGTKEVDYFPHGKVKLRPLKTGLIRKEVKGITFKDAHNCATNEYFTNKMKFANHAPEIMIGDSRIHGMDTVGMLDFSRKKELLPSDNYMTRSKSSK